MKYKKPLIVAASISMVGMSAFALSSYIPTQEGRPAIAHIETVKKEQNVSKPTIEPTIEPTTTEEITNPAPLPASEPVVSEPAPKPVLSIQEYGQQYLDLSQTIYQKCFDRITSYYPSRFTADVRENNIKALRVFANLCSTGVSSGSIEQSYQNGTPTLAGSIINSYGPDGAFFDSPLAASKH